MQRFILAFWTLVLSISLSGCGAIFTSSQALVDFQSDPPGARVMVDGMPVGETPIQAYLSNRKDHMVSMQLGDGQATNCQLTSSVGAGWVILDVLLTGIVGVIIDAATSGWSELNQTGCYGSLRPAETIKPKGAPVAQRELTVFARFAALNQE